MAFLPILVINYSASHSPYIRLGQCPTISTHLYISKDANCKYLQFSSTGQAQSVQMLLEPTNDRVFGGSIDQLPHLWVQITLKYVLHSLPEFLGRISSSCPKWWLALIIYSLLAYFLPCLTSSSHSVSWGYFPEISPPLYSSSQGLLLRNPKENTYNCPSNL